MSVRYLLNKGGACQAPLLLCQNAKLTKFWHTSVYEKRNTLHCFACNPPDFCIVRKIRGKSSKPFHLFWCLPAYFHWRTTINERSPASHPNSGWWKSSFLRGQTDFGPGCGQIMTVHCTSYPRSIGREILWRTSWVNNSIGLSYYNAQDKQMSSARRCKLESWFRCELAREMGDGRWGRGRSWVHLSP
jgi:hypothetical protein